MDENSLPSAFLLPSALLKAFLHYLWWDISFLQSMFLTFLHRLSANNRRSYHPPIKRTKYLMNVSDHSCRPLYPQVLLYNRIFKTASTTMSSFLEKCGKKLKYVIRKGKWNEQNKINMKRVLKGRIPRTNASLWFSKPYINEKWANLHSPYDRYKMIRKKGLGLIIIVFQKFVSEVHHDDQFCNS